MKFLKFLHAVNQSLHAFLRHGIIAGCTESTYRTVSLDTYHTSFGSELQEVSFQFLVLKVKYLQAGLQVRPRMEWASLMRLQVVPSTICQFLH